MTGSTRFTALLAACCLFGGCAPEQADTVQQIKIGVTQYKQDDTFIGLISDNLAAIAKQRELEDGVKITVNFEDGRGNQGIQNDQVEKFLSQGYDAICVNEVDRTAAAFIIDKAKAAGVPVVFFNREPVEEDLLRWDKVYYVGSDAGEIGDMQGRIVAEAFRRAPEADRNGDGVLQYVMLEGEPGHQDAVIRTEYSIRRLNQEGLQTEKLANDTANWQRAQAMTKMSQWISAYGERIEVVISNNDDMALGALDAYRAAEIENLPLIVGTDATPAAIEAVEKGRMTGTVVNDAQAQAQAIFDIAYCLSQGIDPEGRVEGLEGRYVFTPPSSYVSPEPASGPKAATPPG